MADAGVELSIGLFGDTQIAGRLLQTAQRVSDASPWFRMMSGWLEQELEQQFESEGSHWSGGWKALSPAYAAQKALDGYGEKGILERTGALRKSLTRRGGDAIRLVSPHQLVFGSTVAYGAAHQKPKESSNVPRRPMLDLARDNVRRTARSLGLFVARDQLREPGAMSGGTGGGGR